MDSTIIQIPVTKSLRNEALKAAQEDGFSSLQDLLRLVLVKISRRELSVGITEPAVKLSAKNEKRYIKMTEDFHKGKNFKSFDSIDALMKDLHA